MQNGIVALAREHTMKVVEIFHGFIDVPDKLSMTAITELLNRMGRLGFERERVSFAQIHKPAMEWPATFGIRVIVPLFVKRAGRLDVSSPCDAHEFSAGRFGVLSMLQHMRGIHIVE